MTTTVVYSDVADSLIEYSSATYSTARGGTGSPSGADNETFGDTAGQAFFTPNYFCMETFYPFDTSAIADTDTVTAAQFSVYGQTDSTTTNCTLQLAAYDFGATVTTADWQDGTELTALTVLATFATAGFSTAGYNDFTDSGGMAASINLTGTTRYVLYSDRLAAGTVPTNGEYVQCYNADNAGTTNDPKLTVTSTPAGQALRPDADTTTTGWTTTPLWSKIEEVTADATIVTATTA